MGAATEMEQAASQIAAAASRIHSVYYKGSVSIALDGAYVEAIQKRGNKVPDYVKEQKALVEYFYHEGKFSLGVEHSYANGKILGSVVKNWDGNCHQTLYRHSRLLSISQREEKFENRYWWLLQGTNLPFLAYGFLNPDNAQVTEDQVGRCDMIWVHPDGVASMENWKQVLERAVLQKPEPGQKGIVYRVDYPHAYDIITFAVPDYFPMAFCRYNKQDRKIKEYEVVETRKIPLGKELNWTVPALARYKWYEGATLIRTDMLKLEEVAINDAAKFDPSTQFFIDPVMADRVYDADNDKVIAIPH